jgi:hypothetical protein
MGERWTVVSSWSDSDCADDQVDLAELCSRLVEALALLTASVLCRSGRQNYTREDDQRMRDAVSLIDAEEQTQELEGLLDLMLTTGGRPGAAVPAALCLLHKARDNAWIRLAAEPSADSSTAASTLERPTHAVLGPAWHGDDRLAEFAVAMREAWVRVLQAER